MAIIRGNSGSITLPTTVPAIKTDVIVTGWSATIQNSLRDISSFTTATDGSPTSLVIGQRINGTAEAFLEDDITNLLTIPALGDLVDKSTTGTAAEFVLTLDTGYTVTFQGVFTVIAIANVSAQADTGPPTVTLTFENAGSLPVIANP